MFLIVNLVLLIFSNYVNNSYASSISSYQITSSGTISSRARLKKFVVIYGTSSWTDQQAAYIASNFDIVLVTWQISESSINKVKELNSNVKVLIYKDMIGMLSHYEDWEDVDEHEDWFLHDIDGNRLVHADWDWYLMDPGNNGWRNHVADIVKIRLDEYPQLDGIYLDDVWAFFREGQWTVPSDKLPPDIAETWRSDMMGMLDIIKQKIDNKILIGNTMDNIEYPHEYTDHSDGKENEGFVHPYWHSAQEYHYPWDINVNALQRVSGSGKYYLALSGVPDGTDSVTTQKILTYCLCSYLLGFEGEGAAFGFCLGSYSLSNLDTWVFPVYEDVERLGAPNGSYYSASSVYARDFSNGMVLVNPSSVSHDVDLGGSFETLEGQVISSTTLEPYTGIILLGPLS